MTPAFDIVIPTCGRPTLEATLDGLMAGPGPLPGRVVVVDDRPAGPPVVHPRALAGGVALDVRRTEGRGPAAARNAGWRACASPWVVFLDDDVIPAPGWRQALVRDLAGAGGDAAAVQGRLFVPLPGDRRPTDRERDVQGLESAPWATADMAIRRAALRAVGGFDERFPRAYREDADLGLRLQRDGWRLQAGTRVALHPVGPAPWWSSVARQRGNAEDPFMRALHGPRWRERAGAPRGRLRRHALIAGAGAAALAAVCARRPRAAAACGAAWALGTAELAAARILPGPRTPGEVAAMAATSAVLPAAAVGWSIAGRMAVRRRLREPGPRPVRAAVLFDRDGTLIHDVPYNGDPARVVPVEGARDALDRLRAAGVPVAVVSNQSGVARGLLSEDDVRAVNARVAELLGPFDAWLHCPHGPGDGCACRKPAPGMVRDAARRLGLPTERCVVIGDIGADVQAATAAGARSVLVPTPVTRPAEVRAAARVAATLGAAVDLVLAEASA